MRSEKYSFDNLTDWMSLDLFLITSIPAFIFLLLFTESINLIITSGAVDLSITSLRPKYDIYFLLAYKCGLYDMYRYLSGEHLCTSHL